jgi:hydrogenase/urease accessory protein HupE
VKRLIGLLVPAAMLCAAAASAHRLSPAYFGLTETQPGVYDAEWKVSIPGGLSDVLEPQVPDGCSVVDRVRNFVVNDARLLHAQLSCATGLAGKTFMVNGLAATDTDVLLHVAWLDGSSFTHRLVPSEASVIIPAEPGALEVIATYLVLGVEHILLGVDHLLFVFALLLLVRGVARLVATVTAFTVAHSITLGAAALGFVSVPSAPVEATIALSILFLASELAHRERRRLEPENLALRFPWLVAFAFGLLHGFGFAGALAEIGLPGAAVPLALLFFNLGVEIGQLVFIAAVLTLAAALRRFAVESPPILGKVAAYAIGCTSAVWVIERTVLGF